MSVATTRGLDRPVGPGSRGRRRVCPGETDGRGRVISLASGDSTWLVQPEMFETSREIGAL